MSVISFLGLLFIYYLASLQKRFLSDFFRYPGMRDKASAKMLIIAILEYRSGNIKLIKPKIIIIMTERYFNLFLLSVLIIGLLG